VAAAQWDVVVAGAGHNSLVATAYLARAGLRCLVLEARRTTGGNTATEELTLPGFRHDSCSTAHNVLQASPVVRDDELGLLAEHGLTYIHPDPVVHVPFPDGTALTMWRDLDATCEQFAQFDPADADAYRRMIADYDRVKGVFGAHRSTPVGYGPSLDERLAGTADGVRWRRTIHRSAWELIRETFVAEHSQAFMLFLAFMTMQPVDRVGTAPLAYSLPYGRQQHSWILPAGGSGALPAALVRCITAHGGEVVTDARVAELVLRDGRCVGVRTDDGTEHRARRAVLSTVHVKHLVDMAPRSAWGDDFVAGVQAWQAGVAMFVTHYATSQPPRFPTPDGAIAPVAAGVPTSVDRVLRIGAQMARGQIALDDPPLLVLCPSVADPSRAPAGRHTLKVIGFQPYELADGAQRWDDVGADVSAANLAHLRRYAPNITDDALLASVVKTPLDLERMNAHNWHGTCHGGDMGPAQSGALRPVPGWAQHRMPIPGLYQTGATTHPGGSVSAGPGRNAARVLLDDLGVDFATAVR
jgi:phytoene dehydrogenase-like protein